MRDVLLTGITGFLVAAAGGFSIRRKLWKATDEELKKLQEISDHVGHSTKVSERGEAESFESYILRRASQWWNSGVDNVHGRLLALPGTAGRIVDDIKGKRKE